MSQQGASFTAVPPPGETEQTQLALRRIATVALLAIILGFFMQGLILAGKIVSGGVFPGHLLLVDIANGVTWSFLVCLGVAIGVSLGKVRPMLAGLTAMIFAPVAVAVAKASQKVVASLIGAPEQQALLSVATISVVRAVEYGLLGWLLARLAQKQYARAASYFGIGAAIGLVFGGTIVALTYRAGLDAGTAPALPQIVGGIINEVGFPIGCAFLIYVGQLVGRSIQVSPAAR